MEETQILNITLRITALLMTLLNIALGYFLVPLAKNVNQIDKDREKDSQRIDDMQKDLKILNEDIRSTHRQVIKLAIHSGFQID